MNKHTKTKKRLVPAVTFTAPMVNFGPSVEAVRAAREAILAVMGASGDREVLVAALAAFTSVCSVKNNTVTNSAFTGLQA